MQKEMYGTFENTFMMYLPRLCEHCLNPACVASCPSGSIYKREDDGIVLIDQDKCRLAHVRVRLPVQEDLLQLVSGKAEKCIFCYPRIEAGQPTVCSETCVGRIRYLGVLLYDADRIEAAASVADEQDLYRAAGPLPRPARSAIIAGAPPGHSRPGSRRVKSPVYKMAVEWKVASRCIRNTAPCRWCGTSRRCRRSRAAAESAAWHERHART
jgi:nitrate reductase beta subunit